MMRRKVRAMALISLLMVSVLCMMMLAAFLQSNRNYLQLVNRGVSQQTMDDSTLSLADFARYKLEQNKRWALPFTANAAGRLNGEMTWYEHHLLPQSPDEGVVTGTLSNGLVYRMDIVNNLRGSATKAGVQPKSCQVKIAIYDNPKGRDLTAQPKRLLAHPDEFFLAGGCRVLLRNAALYDSGIVASTGIALHAKKLDFLSKDPIRNQVRSNAAIVMPNSVAAPKNYDFGFLKKNAAGEFERYTPRGYDGTVWAKDAILFGDDTAVDEAKIAHATENTNAHFIPNAMTHYSIPELEPTDIKVANDDWKTLDAGVFTFRQSWVEYDPGDGSTARQRIEVLEQRQEVDSDLPVAFYYSTQALPSGTDHAKTKLLNDDYTYYADVPHFAQTGTADATDTFELPDFDGDYTGLLVDLTSRTMTVKSHSVVDVKGDFVVTSEDADTGGSEERPVKLQLGTSGEMGTVRAEGEIKVEGRVYGKGSLISSESISMWPNNVDVATDEVSDLAVYAKDDVVIRDPSNSGGTSKVTFKGLVYAGRNFHFRSNSDLEVEGALVARAGHVYLVAGTSDGRINAAGEWEVRHISATNNLRVTYNPDYLDSLLNTSTQERTKVEVLAWRPGL